MATNGNRWLKERGGKNPLTRIMEQRGTGPTKADINLGSTWVHKITGLRFSVEVFEEEQILLAPVEEDAMPLEVTAEQFHNDFVPAGAYRPVGQKRRRPSGRRRNNGQKQHRRRGGRR